MTSISTVYNDEFEKYLCDLLDDAVTKGPGAQMMIVPELSQYYDGKITAQELMEQLGIAEVSVETY